MSQLQLGTEALDRAVRAHASFPGTGEDYLAHFGIKGMRWGVRRSKAELAGAAADPDAVKAVQTQAKIKAAGSLNVVSSKDLSDLVKRMELEQKYVKATLESSPQTKKGNSLLRKVIGNEVNSKLLQGKDGPLLKAYKLARGKYAEKKAHEKFLRDWSAAIAENKRRGATKAIPRGTNPLSSAYRPTTGPAGRRSTRAQSVYNVTTMGQNNYPNPFLTALPPRSP